MSFPRLRLLPPLVAGSLACSGHSSTPEAPQPPGQPCAVCHGPEQGWTGPNADINKRPRPDFVKAYGHNGYFKSLEAIVHFYNTRDVLPVCLPESPGHPGADCWPPPEQGLNVNTEELGNLGLSEEEEAALVAFLRTLSDGFFEP